MARAFSVAVSGGSARQGRRHGQHIAVGLAQYPLRDAAQHHTGHAGFPCVPTTIRSASNSLAVVQIDSATGPAAGAQWIVATIPMHIKGVSYEDTQATLLQVCRSAGFTGKIVVTSHHGADTEALLTSGADIVLEPFQDAADRQRARGTHGNSRDRVGGKAGSLRRPPAPRQGNQGVAWARKSASAAATTGRLARSARHTSTISRHSGGSSGRMATWPASASPRATISEMIVQP